MKFFSTNVEQIQTFYCAKCIKKYIVNKEYFIAMSCKGYDQ